MLNMQFYARNAVERDPKYWIVSIRAAATKSVTVTTLLWFFVPPKRWWWAAQFYRCAVSKPLLRLGGGSI